MFKWNGKEYRNIQEQVKKNMDDITELIKKGYKGYTAGENIHISDEGVISADGYTAGDGINISDSNTITIDLAFIESNLPSNVEGTGININYDSETNEYIISVDTTTIATKNYVLEKIGELPQTKYLHRIYVHTDGGNAYVSFNVITNSSTEWTLGNLPKSLTIAVDVLNASWDLSGQYEFTLITNAAGDDFALEDQGGSRTIDFEGLISLHDRVQQL